MSKPERRGLGPESLLCVEHGRPLALCVSTADPTWLTSGSETELVSFCNITSRTVRPGWPLCHLELFLAKGIGQGSPAKQNQQEMNTYQGEICFKELSPAVVAGGKFQECRECQQAESSGRRWCCLEAKRVHPQETSDFALKALNQQSVVSSSVS